jgi:hypothetical protein
MWLKNLGNLQQPPIPFWHLLTVLGLLWPFLQMLIMLIYIINLDNLYQPLLAFLAFSTNVAQVYLHIYLDNL